ncbi:MAG: hypothetical protein IJB91_06985 [Oscillospiraceae bacterium]|nr:hypothetical protein [Oscillospiraceae bacterium]
MLIGDNTEENSVLGDKADGLTQSAAHLVGSRALSLLGVPTALTMGVNAFGSEIENAYKNGATHTQAWISASVAAGAEILFERLSDGLKSPKGTNVDDTTMQTLSQNISQKVVNTLLKWFKEDATEGLEEVFTDIVNKVAQKLTYADKMTWEKVFSTEDAWDSFLGGLLLSRGMRGADAIIVNSNAFQNAGLEDIAGKLSRGEALSAAERQRLLDAVLKNTAQDTAADSNESSRVTEPGKFGMTGWDGRVAVTEATGPKVTVGGKTYELIGYDKDGAKVYQDAEVLKEQAEAESKQMEESEPVSQEESALQETETEENPEWFATALDSAEASSADRRDNLTSVAKGHIMDLQRGFMCFPEGDPLIKNSQKVTPKEGFFDVAMHGSPTAVAFGGKEANMSPRLLAEVIRHNPNYHRENIRLLCCSTGLQVDGAYCFAEELANALGVTVEAPNKTLYIDKNGNTKIGDYGEGEMIPYEPNKRRRIK